MDTTIIVVTLNRPECLKKCIEHVGPQMAERDQLIVVDASADTLSREVVQLFPGVLYLRNENGFGRMTASRNIGLLHATGEIIAFLDDDAFAHPGWLQQIQTTYLTEGESVGAVGGRVLNNQPHEETLGRHDIGKLRPDGTLWGFFAADSETTIEVDHIMGCNMSFRRRVIAELGGFREDYPGISGVREDSDMSLRVKALGYKILFNPQACVDHLGAPQAVGKRFDYRYNYFAQRNHLTMLIRNFGPASPMLGRYLVRASGDNARELLGKLAGACVRATANSLGVIVGVGCGLRLLARSGKKPARVDEKGQRISAALTQTGAGAGATANPRVGPKTAE